MQNDFEFFGYFETPSILQKILSLSNSDWKLNDFLEKNSNCYKRAKIIPIVGIDWEKKDFEYLKEKKNLFETEITNLHNFFLHKFKEGRITRCIITLLPSQSTISSHIDDNEHNSKRFLIPILTQPEVYYQFDSIEKQLFANEVWIINYKKPFALKNYSHTNNIHITIDWSV